jgi:two-component system LytT family response regulator
MKDPSDAQRQLTAVVVDDERLARKDLTSMLEAHEDIAVVGQAGDARSAARLISRLDPDVVFLDIQMPGESGFDLLDRAEIRAKIVFVTAYDEYALRAFEVNALDYLMKPVSRERLAKTVERLLTADGAVGAAGSRLRYDDSLFLRVDGGMKFLKIGSIAAISAAGDYTEVVSRGKGGGLTSMSMREWEARLPAARFCRIHRSTIVNLDCVEKVEHRPNHTYEVHLTGLAKPFSMSRRYAAAFKHRLR